MSDCKDFYVQMHEYIDGELPQTGKLFAHLEQCAHCRALFDEYREIASAARRAQCSFPEGLHMNIMQAVLREKKRRAARKIAKIALPFAACAAIAVAVYLPHGFKAGSAAPENAGAELRIAGFAAGSGQATAAATAAAPPAGAPESVQNQGGGETLQGESADKTALDANAPPAFPPLARSVVFGEYIVAYGASELPSLGFDGVEVDGQTADGWVFIIYEGKEGLGDAVQKTLTDAGFSLDFDARKGDPNYNRSIIAVYLPQENE